MRFLSMSDGGAGDLPAPTEPPSGHSYRSGPGAWQCRGDAEAGDELRDRPVVAVGDVVRADGGQRGVGGDPVPDLLPGLAAELLDGVVGVRVDGVQVVGGQLVEEGVVP